MDQRMGVSSYLALRCIASKLILSARLSRMFHHRGHKPNRAVFAANLTQDKAPSDPCRSAGMSGVSMKGVAISIAKRGGRFAFTNATVQMRFATITPRAKLDRT